jgi:hypothetical protein
MLYTNTQVLEAARTIRPILTQLLESEAAQAIDFQLAQRLNQTDLDKNNQVDYLLEILASHTETQAWWHDFLENNTAIQKAYSGLAGNPALQSATKYVCPHNDYTWYREDSGPIPLCPTHLIALIPAQP